MSVTIDEYAKMADGASPKSKLFTDCIGAFCVGGFICMAGQLLLDTFAAFGFAERDAGCMTSVSLIFFGALLTFFGWYDNIAKFGGAGTLVPITGFANAVASPAMEFKSEGFIPGLGAKMFIIAGPVIVYGTVASILYGIFIVIFR